MFASSPPVPLIHGLWHESRDLSWDRLGRQDSYHESDGRAVMAHRGSEALSLSPGVKKQPAVSEWHGEAKVCVPYHLIREGGALGKMKQG